MEGGGGRGLCRRAAFTFANRLKQPSLLTTQCTSGSLFPLPLGCGTDRRTRASVLLLGRLGREKSTCKTQRVCARTFLSSSEHANSGIESTLSCLGGSGKKIWFQGAEPAPGWGFQVGVVWVYGTHRIAENLNIAIKKSGNRLIG